MIRFKLIRKHFKENYTVGKLYYSIDNKPFEYFCDTLEDAVRDFKIYGETAIPAGEYEFILTYSPHFKKILPLLLNVKNYKGVMIHSGNDELDTLGCILVGKNSEKGKVTSSVVSLNNFIKLLEKNKQEKYILEIINEI